MTGRPGVRRVLALAGFALAAAASGTGSFPVAGRDGAIPTTPAAATPAAAATSAAAAAPTAAATPAAARRPWLRATAPWRATLVAQAGDTIGGWPLCGLPDGLGVVDDASEPPQSRRGRRVRRSSRGRRRDRRATDRRLVRVLLNHELVAGAGFVYELAGGVRLRGARITELVVDVGTERAVDARLAYDRVVDRAGVEVTRAVQVNEGRGHVALDGFDRFCSGVYVPAGQFGFRDAIYLAGEENTDGTLYALDVRRRTLHAVAAVGRAFFENAAPLETGDPGTVALLLTDDHDETPLYLYVGRVGSAEAPFLERNGLADGVLMAWVCDAGDRTSDTFHGTGAQRSGHFVALAVRDARRAGTPGYDAWGWAGMDTLRAMARALGAFRFDRPEDVATDPARPHRAALAITGHGERHAADAWGAVAVVDVRFGERITAAIRLIHDADDAGGGRFPSPDHAVRNPDNLCWAGDGMLYVQEDRAVPASVFGSRSGAEASIWRVDPRSGRAWRIARVDRSALPADLVDAAASMRGTWETSGIVDASDALGAPSGEIALLLTLQAHAVGGPRIGGAGALVEAGQVILLRGPAGPYPPGRLR